MKQWTMKTLTGMLMGGLTLVAWPALAAPPGSWVAQEEGHQQQLIRQGAESGQISPREFNRLQPEQARIRAEEGRMMADQQLDPRERARLDKMRARNSAHSYRAGHNRQVVGPPGPPGPPGHYNHPGPPGPPRYHGHPRYHRHPGSPGHPRFAGGVDAREWRQQQRIHQGVRSGQINPGELRRLQHEQARVHGADARMRADGRFTPGERAQVNRMQNRSSNHINAARHNGRMGQGR